MKRRFSTTDDDSIEKSGPCFQEPEKDVFADKIMTNFLDFFWQYELAIVAVTTSEIASCGENYRSNFARIIEQGRFFYTRQQHIRKLKDESPPVIPAKDDSPRGGIHPIPSFSYLIRESRLLNHSNSWRPFGTFDGKSTTKPPKGNKLARHIGS